MLREIVYHILCKTDDNIGLMFLEESTVRTAKGLMSIHANKPLHLPDTAYTDEEFRDAFEHTLGTNRVYLFDHFGSTSIDNILSRVRFMSKGLGCSFVVLDHISIIVSAGDVGDERKALDEIMTKLRMLVQETGISLLIVSHLKRPDGKGHEEGAITSLSDTSFHALPPLQTVPPLKGLCSQTQAQTQTQMPTHVVRCPHWSRA